MKAPWFKCLALLVIPLLAIAPAVQADPASTDGGGAAWADGGAPLPAALDEITGSMEEVASNTEYRLYVDAGNANFLIAHKDGACWSALPADDQIQSLSDEEAANAASLLRLTYYKTGSTEEQAMAVSADSLARQQVQISRLDGGVRFDFVLGRQGNMAIPLAITETRMNELILNKIEDDWDRRRVTAVYNLYSQDTAPSDEDFEAWANQYPILREQNIYVLSESAVEREIQEMEELFSGVGYTADMAAQDNGQTGAQAGESDEPWFQVSLQIQLNKDGFTASIPVGSIQGNESYTLHTITALEYFFAGQHGEEGYVFYPDGAGLRIDFGRDGRTSVANEIHTPLYGFNAARQTEYSNTISQAIRLPVYGIHKASGGFLAVIEKGDALAELSARSSIDTYPFNTVYPTFEVCTHETFDFGDWGGAGFSNTMSESESYQGELRIRFLLLPGGSSGISEMAAAYRSYLIDKDVLKDERLPEGDIPFYAQALGSFDEKASIFGMSVTRKAALTTFEQAQEMMDTLLGKGIGNLQFQYVGWANNGLNNKAYNGLKPEGVLGGKGGLEDLAAYAADKGVGFYPDLELQVVAKNTWFDGFSPGRDSVKTLDRQYGGLRQHYWSDGLPNDNSFRYVLSPDVTLQYGARCLEDAGKLNLTGLSAASIGEMLHSNFNTKNPINRQTSLNMMADLMAKMADKGTVMTEGGNAYALAFSRHILDMPLTSSGYSVRGGTVPFLPMVLHGYVEYAGEPVNLSGDPQKALLEAAATGSGLLYTFSCENADALRETFYQAYYSTGFADWIEKAAEDYAKLNAVLREVSGQEMTGYQWLDIDGVPDHAVSKTTYANGKAVYVNRSEISCAVESVDIPAGSFVLI